MNDLQAHGRAHYKRGEYRKAIGLFDRAIGRAPSVQLLDNRAACYEKLNELSAALSDAKKAIQLHREDATGYLRAGKVLVKMDKRSVALEIYTHGLKSIRHVGQGYELLKNVHKALMDELSPPKSVDPMTMLPRELAEIILEHLSFRQRMNACLVSKQWALFIKSCPGLWRHLDLSGARKKVKSAFISTAINVARTSLTSATLNYLYDFDKTLAALVKHCSLEELTLLNTGLQGEELTKTLARAKQLKHLKLGEGTLLSPSEFGRLQAALMDRLVSLECNILKSRAVADTSGLTCNKLRRLNVSADAHHQMDALLLDTHNRFPVLETLILRTTSSQRDRSLTTVDLEKCQHLRHVDLHLGIPLACYLKLPTSIVSLALKTTPHGSRQFFTHVGSQGVFNWFLPRLEELQLDIPGMLISDVIYALSGERDSNAINPYTNEGATHHSQFAHEEPYDEPPSKLRTLTIKSATSDLTHINNLLIHTRLETLETLRLPSLQSCSDGTISSIIKTHPKLRLLDLSETNVTGIGVKEAVKTGHLLELLVNDCRMLSSDAVEWARERGVRVQYRMSDTAGGGKKVRY